jgi:hypothetical protein
MLRAKKGGSECARKSVQSQAPANCPFSERQRKAKEIIEASGADTVEYFNTVVRSHHGVTFREQAIIWLAQMRDRKRKPVAP